MPKSHPEDFLTATQVGTMVGRSGRTVVRLAEGGDIPIAAKLPGPNGAHLFRREDAEKLVELLAEREAAKAAGA